MAGDRQFLRAPGCERAAAGCERTATAGRVRSHANRGAEIHDRLRVFGNAAGRRAGLRQRPQLLEARRRIGRLLDEENAREHAFDVAVEDRVALSTREREDRARGRAPDPGQRDQLCERLRQSAAVKVQDFLRRAVKISRPGVVAEARPEAHDFILRRLCERRHFREAHHEALEVRLHRLHLRLLQHHFRHPDTVRRWIRLPGKVAATLGLEPGQEGRRKLCGRKPHGVCSPSRSTRIVSSRTLTPAMRASPMRSSASRS